MSIISHIVSGIKYIIYNKKDTIQKVLLNGSQWNVEIIKIIKLYS